MKGHRAVELKKKKKTRSKFFLFIRNSLRVLEHIQAENEMMEKIFHTSGNQEGRDRIQDKICHKKHRMLQNDKRVNSLGRYNNYKYYKYLVSEHPNMKQTDFLTELK